MGNSASEHKAQQKCTLVENVTEVAENEDEYLKLCGGSPILSKFGLLEEWKKEMDQPNIPNELEDDIRIVCGKISELAKNRAGRSHLLVNAKACKSQRQHMQVLIC